MKYILFACFLYFSSIHTYGIEFEKTNGKNPKGNHCISYVFAKLANTYDMPKKYQNSNFWIKILNSEKITPNLENSLNTWEQITNITPLVILEPDKPLNTQEILNGELLWIGLPHPNSIPENTTKIYIHAGILEFSPYKVTLNHYGDDLIPFMKEHLTWEELLKRTIYLYKI